MNKMEDSPGDNQSSSSSTTNKNDTSSLNNSNTLLHDINSLLNDDDISDITLIPEIIRGDDDITEVPAVKAILAARSPVFRRMLYGKFRETTNNTTNNSNDDDNENVKVKLDYSGKVLQLLVEFCFTDKLDSLSSNTTNTNSKTRGNNNFTLEEKSRLLTNLSGAAHYFDIPKLEIDIKNQLNQMMMDHPSISCSILDECSKVLSGEELGNLAMDRIRCRPKAALLHWEGDVGNMNSGGGVGVVGGSSSTFASSGIQTTSNNSNNNNTRAQWGQKGGVIALNASLLESVIFDDQSSADEYTKFKCLQRWVEGCQFEVTKSDLEDIVEIPRKRSELSLASRGSGDDILNSRTPQITATTPRKKLEEVTITTTATGSHAPSSTNSFIGDVHIHSSTSSPPTPCSKSQNNVDDTDEQSQHEKRLIIAKHLATKLDLSLIPASDLSTTITESQLVPTHDLYAAYRLQALNAERTKSKVFVEGAGLSEVNGTYIQRGVHEGTPMYNKEGIWRDCEETFRIFLCTYSNGNKSWCLSIVPKGKEPGKTTDLDFYECPVSYGKGGGLTSGIGGGGGNTDNSGLGVVPSRGWKLVNYGQPPVPKCSLIPGCLEDA